MNVPTNSYEPMLRESINHFLASYRNGCSNFSAFESIFFRLVQTMPDPPLEITWFYSAMTFHSSRKSTLLNPLTKALVAKDLLQLLISCSKSSYGTKKIALLAPVLYALYDAVCEFSNDDGLSFMGEVETIVEKMVNYICICCDDLEIYNECGDLVICFEDLVGVWTLDRVDKCCNVENMAALFPFLNSGLCRWVNNQRFSIRNLAGVVMFQVFFLSLSLKFQVGFSQGELQRDTLNWAVQTMKRFQNSYFLDLLLRVLLEPSMPVTTILKLDNASLLQKVVYDAVILVDYSFLNSGRWNQILNNHLNDLALVWTLVADVAIHFARDMRDEARAESYVTAFSESQLPPQLIKWVTDQVYTEQNSSLPKFPMPKALIKWLLLIEDKGHLVFSENELKRHARAAICKPMMMHGHPECKSDSEYSTENLCGKEPKQSQASGDEEMVDLLDNSFPAATFCLEINDNVSNGGRKHKRGVSDVRERRLKLVKYNVYETSNGERLLPFSDEDREVMG
nr:uncharacterized protein LOC109174354 [Ipomoea trifida]